MGISLGTHPTNRDRIFLAPAARRKDQCLSAGQVRLSRQRSWVRVPSLPLLSELPEGLSGSALLSRRSARQSAQDFVGVAGGQFREIAAELNTANGLTRGHLGCPGPLIDERYPGVHATGIDPGPAEIPNRSRFPPGLPKISPSATRGRE